MSKTVAYEKATTLIIDSTLGKGDNVSRTYDNIKQSQFDYYAVNKVYIENKFWNINEYNRYVKINAVIYAMVPGKYTTIAALIAHINAAIGASGVTLTLSAVTNLITISAAGVFTFGTNNLNANRTRTLMRMLGFADSLSGANSYTATKMPDLNYTKFIDVCSVNLSQYNLFNAAGEQATNTQIARVYMSNSSSGELQYDQGIDKVKLRYNPTMSIGIMDIFLLDEFGNSLEGFKGDFLLEIDYYTKREVERVFNY